MCPSCFSLMFRNSDVIRKFLFPCRICFLLGFIKKIQLTIDIFPFFTGSTKKLLREIFNLLSACPGTIDPRKLCIGIRCRMGNAPEVPEWSAIKPAGMAEAHLLHCGRATSRNLFQDCAPAHSVPEPGFHLPSDIYASVTSAIKPAGIGMEAAGCPIKPGYAC